MKPHSALYGGLFLQFRLFAPKRQKKKRKDGKTQICCEANRQKNENAGRKTASKKDEKTQNCEAKDENTRF